MPESEIDQDCYRSRGTAERSYIHMGRAVAPENGSVVYPMENTPMSGVYSASYQNLECRPVQHSFSGVRVEGPHFRVADSGSSCDPFPHSPAYLLPENSASHAHLSYYNGHNIHEVEGGVLDPTMGTGRGPFKRKSPGLSLACERGSTSRFYVAGSSSGSSESLPEKPTSDYQNYTSSSIGFPPYRGGSHLFGSEDSLRNVRSRSRLDLEPTLGRTYLSNQSSQHYHPMTHLTSHSGTLEVTHLNADANTHDLNHATPPPAAYGRLLTAENNGMSHEMNQFLVGGSTVDIGHLHLDSIPNRNPVPPPPQYPHGIYAPTMCEGHGNYSRRAVSSYRASPSFSQLAHEAARSENGLQLLSETSSSRYSRSSSVRGWRNNHWDGRSRIAIERFESLSNARDAHDRMGPEAIMMADRLPVYGSRNLSDRYRDMRLDVDNMSYEELLALGERIGHVNTGLSENMISKSLMETAYSSSELVLEEASCAICLEEYKNDEEVGTVKNCGHDYHVDCIKKWLFIKNACPICKAPAMSDSSKEQ
uniref:RING-type E3 ubiquitin transferase n=1 Tax=Fagus sylvatica TaxID=28930 RepID=A0A2N9FMA2_FAGSY